MTAAGRAAGDAALPTVPAKARASPTMILARLRAVVQDRERYEVQVTDAKGRLQRDSSGAPVIHRRPLTAAERLAIVAALLWVRGRTGTASGDQRLLSRQTGLSVKTINGALRLADGQHLRVEKPSRRKPSVICLIRVPQGDTSRTATDASSVPSTGTLSNAPVFPGEPPSVPLRAAECSPRDPGVFPSEEHHNRDKTDSALDRAQTEQGDAEPESSSAAHVCLVNGHGNGRFQGQGKALSSGETRAGIAKARKALTDYPRSQDPKEEHARCRLLLVAAGVEGRAALALAERSDGAVRAVVKYAVQYAEREVRRGKPANVPAIIRTAIEEGWRT